MSSVADAVVAALTARDLEAFIACYAEHAVIERDQGDVLASGHDEIRARYGEMFVTYPTLSVRKITAFAVGAYVVQLEEVEGRGPDREQHIAVYRIEDGLIVHERLLEVAV